MSNYQVKDRLHAKRFTTKPGNCRVCNGPLPIPRPNSKRVCDRCDADPAYLEQKREKENERERMREHAKRAGQPKPAALMKACQHREEKGGEICGIEFEAEPRIGSDGINRGVHSWQKYCPKHRKPKAVARRRWLNRNVENYKRLQRNYRHRNLEKVRAKQRDAAKAKRKTVADILASDERKILATVASMKPLWQKIAYAVLINRNSSSKDVRDLVLKITGQSTSASTVERVRDEMGLSREKGRPRQNL